MKSLADEAELTREEVRTKRISTEEMVRLQLDRINGLRSDVANPDRVPAWSEALEALADLLFPWHDEAFRLAWEDRSVAVVTLASGQKMPVPNARDCRETQLVLMALLDRSGLLVKRRTVSGPGSKVKPVEEPDPQVPVPM